MIMKKNSNFEPENMVNGNIPVSEKADRQPAPDATDDCTAECAQSTDVRQSLSNFPTWADCCAMLGIALGVQILVGILGMAVVAVLGLTKTSPETHGNILALIYLFSMLFAIGGTLIYRRYRGGHGLIAQFSTRYLSLPLLLWGCLLLFAANVVIEPLLNLFPETDLDVGRGWGSAIMLILMAPFFEELLCRGVILESLRARYGTVVALFGSSLFFGLMHIQPQQAVNAFLIGLILGFICLITRSLWASVLIHAMNNALAYLLMINGYADTTLPELVGSKGIYWTIYLLALVVLLFSIWKIWQSLRALREHEKNSLEM